jgi:NAD(P)-dependent dehydrogenase (short-subunit alcohol dehydrogenase family)
MAKQEKGALLITGASTGIGRACAMFLDRSGYRVFAGVRKVEVADHLRLEGSGNITPLIFDITAPAQIARAVETVTEVLGPDRGLSGLVNNAGIGIGGPLEFLPINDVRQQFEVNVIGHIAVTQAFLPLIRKANGRIINIGSMAGRFALPFSGPYAASKFALRGISDALRRELRPWGIFVVLIESGSVETPIWEKSFDQVEGLSNQVPACAMEYYQEAVTSAERVMRSGLRRALSPQVLAKVVRKALETRHPKARYLVGIDAYLGLVGRFLPDRFLDWIIRQIIANRLPTIVMGW